MAHELHVVFDTNIIWTDAPFHLVNGEIANLLRSTRTETHLKVLWFIPETVRRERIYQLRKRAQQLLVATKKLEEITGRSTGMTEPLIDRSLEQLARKEQKTLGLQTLGLNIARARWRDIVDSALERRAPFEAKEEKGFRDALILESVIQLAARLKGDKNKPCALVTKDGLLKKAVTELNIGPDRLIVLDGAAEIQEHIRALSDNVDEDFIALLRPTAASLFRGDTGQPGLWHTAKIREQLVAKFSKELSATPQAWLKREGESWLIYPPHFEGKNGNNITWVTKVENRSTAYAISIKHQSPEEIMKSMGADEEKYMDYLKDAPTWLAALGAFAVGLSKLKTERIPTLEARDAFDVIWKAQFNNPESLERAEVVDCRFVGTIWQPVAPVASPSPVSPSSPSP